MTEIAAIQYLPAAGGMWHTAMQCARSVDDDGKREPWADFMRRAEREREKRTTQTTDLRWRVFVPTGKGEG